MSWGGKKESARATSPLDCYFVIMDNQQEPLRRREVSATKKGAQKRSEINIERCSYG